MTRSYGRSLVVFFLGTVLAACRATDQATDEAVVESADGPVQSEDSGASGPTEGPPVKESDVDLGQSFMIPRKDGNSLSHTPSVVFTPDGKFMLTATSENEVVVFEVRGQKIAKRIRFPEEGTDGVSIDGSGRYAVWALKKAGVAVMEIASEKIVARDAKLGAKWVEASPDGEVVAVTRGKELEIRDLRTLRLLQAVPGHEADITNVAWSADGKLLGSTASDGRVLVYDLSAKRKHYSARKGAPLHAVAFHPRGGFVAYGGQDNQVYQYDFASEREDVISKSQPYWITCLGYSPDGKLLAVGDESCDIWLFDLDSSKLTFHNKHHVECWLSSVAWAPDNETFLFGCRPNSHAGKPAVHQVLAHKEAARSESARQSREKLTQAIDRYLAKAPDPEERKMLESYRKALAQEEEIAVAYGGALADPVADWWSPEMRLRAPDEIGIAQSAPNPQKLPPELEKLAQEHRETLQKGVETLNSNFCVNTWTVKKR